jgi:hypothetical protein
MSIQLNKPYKIIPLRHKRYDSHYNIVSSATLVVPIKRLGNEVSCDVRWENENGELKALHNVMFIDENLMPLDLLMDEKLFEIWTHFYPVTEKHYGVDL